MERIHVKWLAREDDTGQEWRYEFIWAEDFEEWLRYWRARPLRRIYYRLDYGLQRLNAQNDIWERV